LEVGGWNLALFGFDFGLIEMEQRAQARLDVELWAAALSGRPAAL
jgi:hypothetical protein